MYLIKTFHKNSKLIWIIDQALMLAPQPLPTIFSKKRHYPISILLEIHIQIITVKSQMYNKIYPSKSTAFQLLTSK